LLSRWTHLVLISKSSSFPVLFFYLTGSSAPWGLLLILGRSAGSTDFSHYHDCFLCGFQRYDRGLWAACLTFPIWLWPPSRSWSTPPLRFRLPLVVFLMCLSFLSFAPYFPVLWTLGATALFPTGGRPLSDVLIFPPWWVCAARCVFPEVFVHCPVLSEERTFDEHLS